MTAHPACRACQQLIGPTFTCAAEHRQGVSRFGQDIPNQGILPGDRCRDCGVMDGGLHHPDCCVASCLDCQDQRLTCGCDDEELMPE
jgi:hypothetical protein